MKIVILVLAVAALVAVQAKPTHKKSLHKKRAQGGSLKRELTGMLRKMRSQTTSCDELSAAFGELARSSSEMQDMMSSSEMPLSPDDLAALTTRVFGFNIFTDDAARELFTCDLTSSSSLSDLKNKLSGVMYNEFRTIYDYGMLMLPSVKQLSSPSDVNLIDAFDAVGLFDLDAAGVQEVFDLLYGPYVDISVFLGNGADPVTPFVGSNSDKCNYLTEATVTFLEENMDLEFAQLIKNFTGLDVTDEDDVEDFLCAVIDGADSGLSGVYQAIDDQGLIDSLYRELYPYIVEYTPQAIDALESALVWSQASTQQNPYGKKAKKTIEHQKYDVKDKAKKRTLLKAKELKKGLKRPDAKRTLQKFNKKKATMLKIKAKKRELLKAKVKKRALMKTDAKKRTNLDAKRDYTYYSVDDLDDLLAELEQQLQELEQMMSNYDDDYWDNLFESYSNYGYSGYYGNRKAKKEALLKTIKKKKALKDAKRDYSYYSSEDLDDLLAQLDQQLAELEELTNSYGSYGNYDEEYWENLFGQLDQELGDLSNNYGSLGGFGDYGQSSNYGNYGGYSNYGGGYGNYGGGYGNYGGGYGYYSSGGVEEQPSAADIENIQLALDFLKKFASSGLLDLDNDV